MASADSAPGPVGLTACLILGTFLLIWPALYNGQPFFYPDTTAYIRGAAAGIEKLTGIGSPWTAPQSARPQASASVGRAAAAAAAKTATGPDLAKLPDSIIAGRSVYYGALAFAGYTAGGYWLTVLLQSLLLLALTALLLKSYQLLSFTSLSLSILLLCLTPAALYVSFLMPDVFAGIAILCAAMLLYGPSQRSRMTTLFLFATLSYALLTHSSFVLLCLVMWLAALLLYLFPRARPGAAGLLLLPAALLIAFSGEAAFSAGVRHFLGEAPVRPPFLIARLIGDGTGERYMRDHCTDSDLTVCRFVDRLPMHFDNFLWSDDPARGVFSTVDADTRRALSREQIPFALAVIANDPWQQLLVSSHNFYDQLLRFRADEFSVWAPAREEFLQKLPPDTQRVMERSKYYRGEMPVRALTLLTRFVVASATLYLAAAAWRSRRRSGRPSPSAPSPSRLVLMVLFGLVVNAAICGCLSEPLNRFQARIVWLVPMMALLLGLDLRRRSGGRTTCT